MRARNDHGLTHQTGATSELDSAADHKDLRRANYSAPSHPSVPAGRHGLISKGAETERDREREQEG